MDTKLIRKKIENRKEELFRTLSELVQINSENFKTHGNEAECAEFIHKKYRELGLDSDLFSPLDLEGFTSHPDYMDGRNLANRYNVVARYRGVEDKDELMLMGHTDTVEIGDLKNWNKDPLSGEIKDGKIFGRGACDDKYSIATMLFIAKLLKEEGFVPKKNLLLCAYSDEESGGSHGALSSVLKYPCERIVSMDGKNSEIWNCASGGGCMKYTFHTKEPVDSARTIALAIPVVINAIDEFGKRRYEELENNPFYSGSIIPKTSLRYFGATVGDKGVDLDRGQIRFGFYTDKTKEEIYSELAELEKKLTELLLPMGIIGDGFEATTRFFHYAFCEPDSEDVKLMVEASLQATGKKPVICGSCLSDLSVISKYGSKRAFGFGAGRNFDVEGGAHQANEYIECDKLVEYAKTIATYILNVLS